MRDIITSKLAWAMQPSWVVDDFDIQFTVYLKDVEQLQPLMTDPEMMALLGKGETEMLDQEKVKVTAGWEEVFVEDGKVVDASSLGGGYEAMVAGAQ